MFLGGCFHYFEWFGVVRINVISVIGDAVLEIQRRGSRKYYRVMQLKLGSYDCAAGISSCENKRKRPVTMYYRPLVGLSA